MFLQRSLLYSANPYHNIITALLLCFAIKKVHKCIKSSVFLNFDDFYYSKENLKINHRDDLFPDV